MSTTKAMTAIFATMSTTAAGAPRPRRAGGRASVSTHRQLTRIPMVPRARSSTAPVGRARTVRARAIGRGDADASRRCATATPSVGTMNERRRRVVRRAISAGEEQEEDANLRVDARELREVINDSVAAMRTVTPPFVQEGCEDSKDVLREYDVDALVASDRVFNPEMSWLAFNWRVLAMAARKDTPVFEKLRFVAISARNLDEFFAKRVGAI